MSDLYATIRLRPARIALLVRPNDASSVRRFMRICACMWGGIFNPIIPVFRVPPKEWRQEPWRSVRGYKIAKGYVDFFEPDAFVEAEDGLIEKAGLEALRNNRVLQELVLSLNELLRCPEHRDWAELSFGLGVVDSLRHIYETEQRFQLRDKRPAYWVRPESNTAIVEALFGVYPTEKTSSYIGQAFEDVYQPDSIQSGPEAWRKIYLERCYTPLRATRYGIEARRLWHQYLIVFIFDPSRSTDLIDLWNMRNEQNPILPVPITWLEELAEDIAKVILDEYRPMRGNPNGLMDHAMVEFSRSISEETTAEMTELLKAKILPKETKNQSSSPLAVKSWRNEVWVPNLDDHFPHNHRLEVTALERRVSLTIEGENRLTANFEALAPEFAERYGGNNLRWVNTVRLSAIGNNHVATVFPFNTFDRTWPRLQLVGESVLVGSEGWCFGQRYKDNTEIISLYSQENAVVESLKTRGIEAKLSEPGHIAKQILDHLRGLWGAHLLADKETLKLLYKMAGGDGGRTASLKDWEDLIERRKEKQQIPETTLEQFTDRNIIRLGVETTCPHCQATNWQSLDVASYELTCERCLKKYPFPQATLRRMNKNWAFRVIGPFAVPDYARGSYGALLALRALSQFVSAMDPFTFSTALSMSFEGMIREADFVVWHAWESMDSHRKPDLIIGEAKSFGELDRQDIAKLKNFGKELPGSIIAVSILRDDFSEKEKTLLGRLVRWGRRLDDRGRPTNPVLLLTGTELFNYGPLSIVWEKKGGRHASFARHHHTSNLRNIAEATVMIHLELPSFADARRSDLKRRRQLAGEARD